jgi:hypothetical protein
VQLLKTRESQCAASRTALLAGLCDRGDRI